jgi:hypothetical protein
MTPQDQQLLLKEILSSIKILDTKLLILEHDITEIKQLIEQIKGQIDANNF